MVKNNLVNLASELRKKLHDVPKVSMTFTDKRGLSLILDKETGIEGYEEASSQQYGEESEYIVLR